MLDVFVRDRVRDTPWKPVKQRMRIDDYVPCDLVPKKRPTIGRCTLIRDIVLGNAPMETFTLLVQQDDTPLLGERTVADPSNATRRNEGNTC